MNEDQVEQQILKNFISESRIHHLIIVILLIIAICQAVYGMFLIAETIRITASNNILVNENNQVLRENQKIIQENQKIVLENKVLNQATKACGKGL